MLQTLLRMPSVLRLVSRLAHGLKVEALHTDKVVLVFSWRLVKDVLSRDNDFRVASVYGEKMRVVAGDFFLGLDRCPLAYRQRDSGTRGMSIATSGLAASITETAEAAMLAPVSRMDIIEDYARPVACKTAIRLFGVNALSDKDLAAATRAVFHQVFLNMGSNDPQVAALGLAAGRRIRRWTLDEMSRRRASGARPADMLSYLMGRPEMSDEDRAGVLAGYLVGAIDTTTTAFAYIAYEILTRPRLYKQVMADKDDLTRLRGWCYDILRRRPHAPFLPRRTGSNVALGGRTIPGGKLVLAVTSAAHADPNVFIDPDRFDPERPLGTYLHFGAGPHICAGSAVNDLQLPILLQVLLRAHPRRCEKLLYDGPFPATLHAHFRKGAPE